MRKQIVPRHFTACITSHPPQHATQSSLDSRSNLVMSRPGHDALDKAPLLVPIGKLKIVQEAAIRRKRTPTQAQCFVESSHFQAFEPIICTGPE